MTQRAPSHKMIKAVIQNRATFKLYGYSYINVVHLMLHKRVFDMKWEVIGLESDASGLPTNYIDK